MKRRDAERKILQVYRYEYLREPDSVRATESAIGALPFYTWLQNNHPELLDFRFSGDKYQIVAGWVVGK